MKEKLQDFALIAEIIGGIAIVISLVLLLLQINENTNAIRASAYQDIVSELNSWRTEISSDSVKTELFTSYLQGDIPITGSKELTVLLMTLENVYSNWEVAYFAHKDEIIADAQWSKIDRNICLGSETFLWDPNMKKIYI